MIDAQIGTYPAPGVMATSPTTIPVTLPTSVGFPLIHISIPIHDSIPAAADKPVVIKACTANSLACKALPALKPNHPNNSKLAPKTTNGML